MVSALTVPVETAPAGPDPAPPPTARRVAMLSQGHLGGPRRASARTSSAPAAARQGREVRFGDIEMAWRLRHPAYSAHAPDVVADTRSQPRRDRRLRRLSRHRRPRDRRGDRPGRTGRRRRAARGRGGLLLALRRHHGRRAARRDAIAHAAVHLRDGDVLLLEVQRPGENDGGLLPTEIDPADFNAIRDATGAGIVVVEAAANGTRNLDLWRHPTDGLRAMRRDGPGDSQAIVVGSCVPRSSRAGTPASPTPTGVTGSTATRGGSRRHRVRAPRGRRLHHVVQRHERRVGDRRGCRGGGAGHAVWGARRGRHWRPRRCGRCCRGPTTPPRSRRTTRARSVACPTSPYATQVGAANCAETTMTDDDGDGDGD